MVACLAASIAVVVSAVCLLFPNAHFIVVNANLLIFITIFALTVFILIYAIRDGWNANFVFFNFVVAFDMTIYALLCTNTACITIHFTVVYSITANTSDFYVVSLAGKARPRAFLFNTIVNGGDAHIIVICKELPVMALQALAIAVVVIAVRDSRHTLAGVSQRLAFLASVTLALVALTALISPYILPCQ